MLRQLVDQLGQLLCRVVAQVEADDPPAGFLERLLVAHRLRHLEHAKVDRRATGARLVWNRRRVRTVGGELDKESTSAAALVELAGGCLLYTSPSPRD